MPNLVFFFLKLGVGAECFLVTLNDMNHVFIWTDKSGINMSLDSELLTQGLWVPVNKGVMSAGLEDVHFVIL